MALGQTAGHANLNVLFGYWDRENTPFGTKRSPCGTDVYKGLLQTKPRQSCI